MGCPGPHTTQYVLEQTQDRECAGLASAYPGAGPHLGNEGGS